MTPASFQYSPHWVRPKGSGSPPPAPAPPADPPVQPFQHDRLLFRPVQRCVERVGRGLKVIESETLTKVSVSQFQGIGVTHTAADQTQTDHLFDPADPEITDKAAVVEIAHASQNVESALVELFFKLGKAVKVEFESVVVITHYRGDLCCTGALWLIV